MEDVNIALGKALAQTTIGNPLNETVRMGALAGRGQRDEVRGGGHHGLARTRGRGEDDVVTGQDSQRRLLLGGVEREALALRPRDERVEDDVGVCAAMCVDNGCAAGFNCFVANDGILNLCLQACDVDMPDCPPGTGCLPVLAGGVCAPA